MACLIYKNFISNKSKVSNIIKAWLNSIDLGRKISRLLDQSRSWVQGVNENGYPCHTSFSWSQSKEASRSNSGINRNNRDPKKWVGWSHTKFVPKCSERGYQHQAVFFNNFRIHLWRAVTKWLQWRYKKSNLASPVNKYLIWCKLCWTYKVGYQSIAK